MDLCYPELKYHILLKVNNKNIIFYFPPNGENTNIKIIYTYLKEKLNCCRNSFWLCYAGKPLIFSKTLQDYQIGKGSTIEAHFRIRGGFGLKSAVDSVINSVFGPLIKPAETIRDVFVKIYKLIVFCVKIIVWMFMFVKWVIVDLFRQWEIFTEFIGT